LLDGWEITEKDLRLLAQEVDVVMTTANNRAIYHMGRYDYAVTPTQVLETDTGNEFGRDPKSGRYIIGTAASVERVLTCTRSGVFVSSKVRFGHPTIGIDEQGIAVLRRYAQRLPIPEWTHMVVFRWNNEELPEGNHCTGLPIR